MRWLFQYIVCSFLILCYFNSWPAWSNITAEQKVNEVVQKNARVYNCAANSLFVMSKISDVQVTYAKCLELLPIITQGNSMLEVKIALESLGFTTEPLSITTDEIANINVPSIMYAYPPEDYIINKESKNLGHYIVVIPIGNDYIQVLDYPESPVILPVQPWINYLRSNGIENIPIILCSTKKQNLLYEFTKETENNKKNAVIESNTQSGSKFVLTNETSISPTLYWDFGDISEGSFVKHNFTIVNDTQKTLHVSKLSKSCTCGSIATDKSVIEPGETCTATMSLSIAGRMGSQNISSNVVFDTNDNVPSVNLLITGYSHARWLADSYEIDFGNIEYGSEMQKQIIPVRTTEYGINSSLSHVECKSEMVIVEIDSDLGEPNSYLLTVYVDPNKYPGVFSEKIDFFAKGQKTSSFFCNVTGEVFIDIFIQPTKLFLMGSQSPMGSLHLVQRDLKPINLISYNTKDFAHDIAIKSSSVNNGNELQLDINVLGEELTSLKGNIKLDLSIGNEEQIRSIIIPFFYIK